MPRAPLPMLPQPPVLSPLPLLPPLLPPPPGHVYGAGALHETNILTTSASLVEEGVGVGVFECYRTAERRQFDRGAVSPQRREMPFAVIESSEMINSSLAAAAAPAAATATAAEAVPLRVRRKPDAWRGQRRAGASRASRAQGAHISQ
ncbi:MAG TPA: hypothetical protein VGJ84_11980 [Polyangiaceae bacterium]